MGSALLARLGSHAVGTWRHPAPGGIALELGSVARSPALAADAVARADADVVYVAAGMTWVDGCEEDPSTAGAANRDGPAALAAAARAAGGHTVFFSTEYVFDGTAGPYRESDPPRPLSVYGRTKLEGEQAVLDADPGALVVRTTVVWGPEPNGRNFAHQLARRLRVGDPMTVPDDQASSPTYNEDLVDATTALVEADVSGVVHVAGAEVMDRAAFARRLAGAMGLDAGLVHPVPTATLDQRAPRPLRAGLDIGRLRSLLPEHHPVSVEEGMARWRATGGSLPWSWGTETVV